MSKNIPSNHFQPILKSMASRIVLIAASIVAAVSALPFAGSWNDGASLASVECLVDYQTFAIDQSIYVDCSRTNRQAATPYSANEPRLNRRGTLDRVLVDGRFYAAKPPVPMLLMAAPYKVVQGCTGLTARRSPGAFAYAITLLSSGVAYVVAVFCIYQLARRQLRSTRMVLLLSGSFAVGSLALVYSRHVNTHILQLEAVAALLLTMQVFAERVRSGKIPWLLAVTLGTLTGLAFVMDQGVGPVLVVCVFPLVAWRCWPLRKPGVLLFLIFLSSASPWIVAQLALNFQLGHTIAPINSVPEYFAWEGSPWNVETMSGNYSHPNLFSAAVYSLDLLYGKHGFLLHSPVLLGSVVAVFYLLLKHRRLPETAELWFCLCFCVGSWLLYSWGSNNYSGQCVSIRWFLPLLAPGYFIAVIHLRERPDAWPHYLILLSWGMLLGVLMWWQGPWTARMIPGYWFILALLLVTWLLYGWNAWRRGRWAGWLDKSPHRAVAAQGRPGS